ncbi:hypothetical protein DM860_002243 [Cuscuta australis]|uniref:cytokinin riboside 5'-monophosphate phosphoribohydrolase n=1 Tax=Cuscuta australis TaxID=267555 RepID=A0A328DW79_9ASTE|nr:hypothetical protein DM860_002243 [Cuscuta australis]
MEGTSRALPNTIRFVGLFGSHALGSNPRFMATAVDLGRELVRRKIRLTYGGGNVGLQGAIASTVYNNGGRARGFIPGYIATRGVYGPTYGVEYTVSNNYYKYFEMIHIVEAFIVLPGGIDTIEGLFTLISWASEGLHSTLIGLLNIDGYFNNLIKFLDDAVRQNFMALNKRKLFISSFFVDELLDKLEFAKAFPGLGASYEEFANPGSFTPIRRFRFNTYSVFDLYVPEPEHVSVHTVNTEGSSFTPLGDGGKQQNQPEPAGQPPVVPPPVVPPPVMPPLAIPPVAYEQMFPAMMAHYMQHMAQLMPMFQPPPPPQPQPRIVTFKTLKDNGAEEFRGDKMGEPQIALDWLEQMDRVLKDLRVPDADCSELASQMFRKGAYDWWKRIDQDPHTPKPWTWDCFDRAFTKEYVPTRYREERRDEFVALKQEGMSLPELRQKFDYLSQYATSLVSTPEDRLNEFVKKLRPDLRPYAVLITTTDFNAAYDLIVKTEKSLDDLQATKKEDRATKDPRPAASTGPSGKSFGFGGKRYEKGSSSAPPPKRTAVVAVQLEQPAAGRPPCRSTTPASRKPEPPRRSQSPEVHRSSPSSAAVALSTAAILAVECNAAVSPLSVVRRRRLQRRQSLLIAVELPLRHCRRRPSPSPHPAAVPDRYRRQINLHAGLIVDFAF